MSQVPLRIGIVGAGTAGLYLALLLQRAGHSVRLFDRAASPRTQGCGILLVSAGLEAIAQGAVPGLLDQLLRAGQPVRRFVIRNLKGGVISRSEVDISDGELPSQLIQRSAILSALWNCFDASDFRGNSELIGLRQQENEVSAFFANGDYWNGDILIGADGIFSRVARSVAPERRLCYLGDRVWRGVVADPDFCLDGDFFVYARGRGIYANFFDLGPTKKAENITHWGFFHEQPLPEQRSEQQRLLTEPVPTEALARLPADAAAVISGTPAASTVCNWNFDIEPLARLSQGRVALIGDAAHAMSSSQARGMTAGLEDALVLATELNRCPAEGAEGLAALAAYGEQRLPVVHRYQARSRDVSVRIGRRRRSPLRDPQADFSSVA